MTSAYIQSKGDGLTNTIMLSESLTAHQWAYNQGNDAAEVEDRKYHFGFCWEDPDLVAGTPTTDPLTDPTLRKINGQRVENSPTYGSFGEMVANHGYPSSNHPGGVNVAFCGGQVQFVSDQISPTVYAQLMTSNRKGRDLVVTIDGQQVRESQMKQPSDGEF
jgi:prepilin-type processing-associated H-X9-DG protein